MKTKTAKCKICGKEFLKRAEPCKTRTAKKLRPSFALTCSKECSKINAREVDRLSNLKWWKRKKKEKMKKKEKK